MQGRQAACVASNDRLSALELTTKSITMVVSQNRVSRMENGDLGSMSLDTLRRYVEALGGHLTLVAELPSGTVMLA